MNELTIAKALQKLGFAEGYGANDVDGILAWDRPEPQPTEAELIAAGWIKPEPTPEEETIEE